MSALPKITFDPGGAEAVAPPSALFESRQMTDGRPRLLLRASPTAPDLFRDLASRLTGPLYLLYVLHTPRGEGEPGRYQSPALDVEQVEAFLTDFAAFLTGDARHDIWVHSTSDGRTVVLDRHDRIFVEGGPLVEMTAVLEARGYRSGAAPRPETGPHVHHYRAVFDAEAAAVLARFDWDRTDLRPEDEQ